MKENGFIGYNRDLSPVGACVSDHICIFLFARVFRKYQLSVLHVRIIAFHSLNKPDDNLIYLRQGSGTTSVDLNKTAYFEGMLRKTIVHYSDGTDITVNIPLKEIEGYINSIDFVRTHQSYIVNLAHVTRALKTKLVIANTDIPISRKYAPSTADAVSRYIGRKMMQRRAPDNRTMT